MKFFLLLLTLCFTLYSKEPKLELGLGISSLSYPNYIGSKSTQVFTFPYPHIRYRGDIFTIDEDGLTGKLFGVNGLRLDLSFSGALPASSEEGSVRADMPNLDLTGEVGFQIIYTFYEEGKSKLEFEFPLRAVLSTDFQNINYVGLISNPQLKYSLNYTHFEWTLRSGIILSDADYNNYYYEVQEPYVTPQRELYSSEGGYAGFRNRIGMTYKKGSWWGGAFVSHYDISGAVFNDSPLVETNEALYFGASLAYIFYTYD